MQVIHLAWEFPPRLHGGLGRHVHGLTRALARGGLDVTVVTNPSPATPDAVTIDGVRVIRVEAPAIPTADWVSDVRAFNRAAAPTVEALLAGGGTGVVHVHDWMVAFAAGHALRLSGMPLVATIHATEQGRHQGWLPSPLSRSIAAVERTLVGRAQQVIVCSRWMRGEVLGQLGAAPERTDVIPNAWEPPDRPPATGPREPRLVAFAGRLEYEKGVHVLLQAASVLSDVRPRLVIAGDGTYRDELAKQAAALGVDVEFPGFLAPEDVAALFARAAVVVVPSLYEPFGLTALEALNAAAPLVVTATGGLAELVADGSTGLVVPPGDHEALAAALRRLLDDPAIAQRLGLAGKATAAARPTWDSVAAATAAVYRRVVNSPPATAMPAPGAASRRTQPQRP